MQLHFTRILQIHGFELHTKRISWPLKHSWRQSYEASKALGRYFERFGSVWPGPVRQQLLLWHLGTDICSTGVHRAGHGHCRAHTALPVLPSLPRHDIFHRQKDVLPTAAATCARAETFDSAVIFRYAGCIMHVKAGIP